MSTTGWWVLGSAVGVAVVVVAATLLIVIILLARRVVRQTAEITLALDGAMRNTNALFDLANTNHALERITRGVRAALGDEGPQDERGVLDRLKGLLPGGGG